MAVSTNGKTAVVPSKAPDTIKRMADAASAFLASLGKPELAKATFPFAGTERYEWHYTPVGRNGLLISEMSGNQVGLAFKMMETGYSASGYQMARQIIRLETILGEYEAMTNSVSQWHRLEERYWFSVFGEPGGNEPWGWRVGGHHIGIVASVAGNSEVSIHPLFFGSNPAEVKHGEHKGMRTLAEEEDWGRALVTGMTDDQKSVAIVDPVAPSDILTTTVRIVDPGTTPQGIAIGDLYDAQREAVVKLIRHYVFRAADEMAMNYWNQLEREGWDSVHFAWAGPLERFQGHYYNIRHDRFVIEYDNTHGANHIHSVLRDYTHDRGFVGHTLSGGVGSRATSAGVTRLKTWGSNEQATTSTLGCGSAATTPSGRLSWIDRSRFRSLKP